MTVLTPQLQWVSFFSYNGKCCRIRKTELKNKIRSGDVWVEGSRLHKDFEEYLVPKDDWRKSKVIGTNIAVNVSFEQYIKERCEVLNTKLQWISKNIDKVESINDLKTYSLQNISCFILKYTIVFFQKI